MFSSWIGDIKVHIFVAGVALMLVVGFFTNFQLTLALLSIHYAITLVIKYDNLILRVGGYFRDRQRKRKELETAKWAEQIRKKPN